MDTAHLYLVSIIAKTQVIHLRFTASSSLASLEIDLVIKNFG